MASYYTFALTLFDPSCEYSVEFTFPDESNVEEGALS